MKILQINAVYKNSSTGRTSYEFHNYLKDRGHDCFTIYGNQRGDYIDTYYTGNIVTQKIHALLARITGKMGYFSTIQTSKVIKFIKKYDPDVVFLRNLHGNFINIPRLLTYLGNNDIPTVIVLHDCFFYTGGCMHYTVNNCYKWRDACKNCKYNNFSWFFDKTDKMFSDKQKLFGNIKRLAVIGVSKWITEEARISPILRNASIIKSAYNGIDLNIFRKKESDFKIKNGLQNFKIILGVAGVWSGKKGLNMFLQIADKLKDDEKIILVGNSAEEIVSDKIIRISATDNVETLVDIYNAADVFLQASKEETFGKVVAEALACGVPVVTNTYTANPELVSEDCGIVVENFTVDNVYDAIRCILKKGKEGYSCRERAAQLFNTDDQYGRYLKISKDIALN